MKLPNKHPSAPTKKDRSASDKSRNTRFNKMVGYKKIPKEFLSDKRVIEVNQILWQLILNLFILTFRPAKTAKAYKKIWMKKQNMSPLRYFTIKQTSNLQKRMKNKVVEIDFAMRYGNPSIAKKLSELKEKGCQEMIVLPLYPQYAAATTATVCDEVYRSLMKMRWQPSLQVIPHYESEPLYIKAIAVSIKKAINQIDWMPDVIVASYHGVPKNILTRATHIIVIVIKLLDY